MKLNHNTDYFYKITDEVFDIEFDFTNDLSGGTLSSCAASIFDSGNIDKTASMISGKTITSPKVTFTISAGTAGETYQIKLVGVSSLSKYYTHYVSCEIFGTNTLNTKLGDITSNSYATLKEANDYIRNKYGHSNLWDTLSTEGRKRVLIEAANILNTFNYRDKKYYDSQRLEFPRDDHEVVTGNCATPITSTSFKNTSLKSDTYGVYPNDYWKYGTCHLTASHEIQNIATSNRTGIIHADTAFTASLTTSTAFLIFAPIDEDIKNAQIEQALYILESGGSDSISTYRNSGIEEVEIGDVRYRFRQGSGEPMPISPVAKKLMSRWFRKAIRLGRA